MTHPLAGRRRTLALLGLVPLLASGCGFQLRGQRPLPFESIHLGMYPYSELAGMIRRQIRANGSTRIVETADEAEVRLEVIADLKEKIILALNSQGRVREYQLRRRFVYRVVARSGEELTPMSEILLKRDLAYDDTQLLAKEQEEILLQRDMQSDLVQQLMRRLAATKMPAPGPRS